MPPFMCRETFYKSVIGQNPEFAARLKLNGHFQSMTPEWGGHHTILGFCHTFYQLIPPEKYFADHPEWFSERNGIPHLQSQDFFSISQIQKMAVKESTSDKALEQKAP